jgi:hypothetical protein
MSEKEGVLRLGPPMRYASSRFSVAHSIAGVLVTRFKGLC